MPNFRLLVHPLLIDFGGGSPSCCCCCCDRGKTKSTPSPKTEVWTLDLGLELDNRIHMNPKIIKDVLFLFNQRQSTRIEVFEKNGSLCQYKRLFMHTSPSQVAHKDVLEKPLILELSGNLEHIKVYKSYSSIEDNFPWKTTLFLR